MHNLVSGFGSRVSRNTFIVDFFEKLVDLTAKRDRGRGTRDKKRREGGTDGQTEGGVHRRGRKHHSGVSKKEQRRWHMQSSNKPVDGP
jgi:hypothetical protein